MGSLIGALLGLNSSDEHGEGQVSLGDIESRLRSMGSDAHGAFESSASNVIGAAAVGVLALVAGAYLHGRRRGRRRSSVLEIKRV